jgi:hypothetical protein
MTDAQDEPANAQPEAITYKGRNIRDLPREELIEAIESAYPEIVTLRARLSDEGVAESAREEDFAREVNARRDFFGVAAEYQSRIFDSSVAYNQIIVLGGYAAFFGVWSAVAKDIPREVLLGSGALILVSLIVYVSWTVVGMYHLGIRNLQAVGTFGEGVDGFQERLVAVEIEAQKRSGKLLRFWKAVVWVSGLTGFVAASALGGAALWATFPKSTKPDQIRLYEAIQRADRAAVKAECNAQVAAIYGRATDGKEAKNPKTGQTAVLVNNKWVILPKC